MEQIKVISGIRPTGNIHLGNYLGAIKQWKELQDKHECVFFVADLHSQNSSDDLLEKTWLQLERCGVSIKHLTYESIFGSKILELYHHLSCKVPIGWLNRMTQFKDKAKTEDATLALFSYPVLMAADIFYFGATYTETLIPIGADQKQHIEFVRDLADKMGYIKPKPLIGDYPRIMSLTDGTKKMSKSDPNDYSRINVTDASEVIRDKIMKAKSANTMTDNTPEMLNLKTIFNACGGAIDLTIRVKDFKEELAELIIKELEV